MVVNRIQRFLSICLLASCFCCSEKKDSQITKVSPDNISVIDIDKPIEVLDPFPWDELIEEVSFIPLETNELNLITYPAKVVVTGEYIYVLGDGQRTLFIFDHTGKYVRKIEEGPAPENARTISDFSLDEEGNIWFISMGTLDKFYPDGKPLERIQYEYEKGFFDYLNPIYIEHVKHGYYVWGGTVGHKIIDQETPPYTLYRLSKNHEVTDKYFPTKRELLEFPRFKKYNNELWLSTFLGNDTIYRADGNVIKPAIVINFGEQGMSSSKGVGNFNRSESQLKYEFSQNNNLAGFLMNFTRTKEHFYFMYFSGKEVYFALVNEQTKSVKKGLFHFDGMDMNFMIMGEYRDKFVTALSSEKLTLTMEQYKNGKIVMPSYVKKNYAVLEKVQEMNNPVVMVMKLKQF